MSVLSFPFCLLVLIDVALWIVGYVMDVSPASRFRVHALATLLLYAILGVILGWTWGSIAFFGGLWLVAVMVGSWRSSAAV